MPWISVASYSESCALIAVLWATVTMPLTRGLVLVVLCVNSVKAGVNTALPIL
ncbi:hypothetical protein BDW75DRAFT_215588 [Aspergillus navahoensis]